MAIINSRFISTMRITRITQLLINRYEMQFPLTFLDRARIENDVDDDEILGEWTGRVVAADIITNDARAVVVEGGWVEFRTNTVPNLKIGRYTNQTMIDRLSRMEAGAIVPGDIPAVSTWYNRMADANVQGIRIRENALLCGMLLDSVVYDKLGVKITGSWGMPGDLKLTPAVLWNVTTSTPISDIQALLRHAQITYGEMYDTVDLSRECFDFITATDEFRARAATVMAMYFVPPAGALNRGDFETMKTILERILKLNVNVEDSWFYVQNTDGTRTQSRYLPVNKVLFTDSRDFGATTGWDLARGIPTEQRLAQIVGQEGFIGPDGGASGPVSYFYAPDDMNPPQLTCYSVDKAFPRKHRKTASAVITAY